MASNVLKTLQEIEQDRQLLINTAKVNGYSIQDDASLKTITNVIVPNVEPSEIPTYDIPQDLIITEDWVRPSEWPDCHQILLDTEPVPNGSVYHIPYMILLLKDDSDETVIYKSENLPNSSIQSKDYLQYSAILTSDGTFYNTTNNDITHVWDKSKDIIISSGENAGTYRYLIYFGQSNSNVSGNKRILTLPVVEIIVDDSLKKNNSFIVCPPLFFGNQSSNTNKYLMNYEVFLANDTNSVPTAYLSYNSGLAAFNYLYNLRNFNIHGSIIKFDIYYSHAYIFSNTPKLRYIDLSSTYIVNTNSNYSVIFCLSDSYSLVSLKALEARKSGSGSVRNHQVYFGYNPNLELLEFYNDTEDWFDAVFFTNAASYASRSYVPKTTQFIGEKFCFGRLPINWGWHDYAGSGKLYIDSSYSITTTSIPYMYDYDVNLNRDILDFSNVLSCCNKSLSYSVFTNNSSFHTLLYRSSYYGPSVYYRGVMIFPEDIVIRLKLQFSIGRTNIINLFNNLKDLSNETDPIYNAKVQLWYYDEQLLTAEDIEIATDKGWTIEFITQS